MYFIFNPMREKCLESVDVGISSGSGSFRTEWKNLNDINYYYFSVIIQDSELLETSYVIMERPFLFLVENQKKFFKRIPVYEEFSDDEKMNWLFVRTSGVSNADWFDVTTVGEQYMLRKRLAA